jgi:hypothetical protein
MLLCAVCAMYRCLGQGAGEGFVTLGLLFQNDSGMVSKSCCRL